MADSPPTRVTLLLRLRDLSDQQAWGEFVELYAPLVYQFARRKGLQDADAADVTQDVLRSAARSLPSFDYDPERGGFRRWLFTVCRHEVCDFHARRSHLPVGSGDTAVLGRLSELPANSDDEADWDREYRQRLFEWAAERVRPTVQPATWSAFWQTAVEGQPPQSVAEQLGLSVGAVYIARSRVLARIREQIERIENP